jgi:hypothetical protein
MTTFDEREKGFEAKYKQDQELAFKVNARRGKLMGLWVAEQLGLSGADADAYAKSVVVADMEEPGEADILRKIKRDLEAKGKAIPEARLHKEMDRFTAQARSQIIAETSK